MKVGALGLQVYCAFQFLARALQIFAKTQYASQCAMSFRITRSQSHRLATLAKRSFRISFLNQRAGQVGMRLREVRPQFQGTTEVSDGGIRLIL